jgi:hypothetical protein
MTEENNIMQTEGLPPYKIAFVIDGEVADVLHTDERLFAIFMSNPLIIDVTEKIISDPLSIPVGSIYNSETNTFSIPQSESGENNV